MLIHAHTVMYALKNICFKASLIALKHDTCNKNNMFSNKLFQKCCMEIQITFSIKIVFSQRVYCVNILFSFVHDKLFLEKRTLFSVLHFYSV
jgi:hypothetical protein